MSYAKSFGTGAPATPGSFSPWALAADGWGHAYMAGAFRGQPLALDGARLAAMGPTDEGFAGRVLLVSKPSVLPPAPCTGSFWFPRHDRRRPALIPDPPIHHHPLRNENKAFAIPAPPTASTRPGTPFSTLGVDATIVQQTPAPTERSPTLSPTTRPPTQVRICLWENPT